MATIMVLEAHSFNFADSTGNEIGLVAQLYSDSDTTAQLYIDGIKIAEGSNLTQIRTVLKPGKHKIEIVSGVQTYTKTAIFKKNELTCLEWFEKGYKPPPPPPMAKFEEPEPIDIYVVSEKPEIIGGMDMIGKNLVYPPMAKKAGVDGKVTLRFIVIKDGIPTNITIIMEKPREMGFGEAAIAALMRVRFKPAMQADKPVPVKMVIPIYFELKR